MKICHYYWHRLRFCRRATFVDYVPSWTGTTPTSRRPMNRNLHRGRSDLECVGSDASDSFLMGYFREAFRETRAASASCWSCAFSSWYSQSYSLHGCFFFFGYCLWTRWLLLLLRRQPRKFRARGSVRSACWALDRSKDLLCQKCQDPGWKSASSVDVSVQSVRCGLILTRVNFCWMAHNLLRSCDIVFDMPFSNVGDTVVPSHKYDGLRRSPRVHGGHS